MRGLVAVTGAGGYLGAALVRALSAAGWTVRRLTRAPSGPDDAPFRLGEPVEAAALRGVDVLLHNAHDFTTVGWDAMLRVNIEGTRALYRAARSAGVRRLLYVSSIAAYEGARSDYGRAKLLLEDETAAFGGLSVRPGLVYGGADGSAFGSFARLTRLPVMPLLDGGRQEMWLGHVDDVSTAVVAALDWEPAAARLPPVLAHPEPVMVADIAAALKARRGERLRPLPVPSAAVLAALRTGEALGLRLPFRSDSVVSLLHGNPRPDFSAHSRLGLRFRPFAA